MVKQVDTVFSRYEFSDPEYFQATIFSDLQIMHIRSEIAIVAQARVLLAVNPSNILESGYTLEYLRGKIEALEALITTSINSTDDMENSRVDEILERQVQEDIRNHQPWVSPADAVRQAFGFIPDTSVDPFATTDNKSDNQSSTQPKEGN